LGSESDEAGCPGFLRAPKWETKRNLCWANIVSDSDSLMRNVSVYPRIPSSSSTKKVALCRSLGNHEGSWPPRSATASPGVSAKWDQETALPAITAHKGQSNASEFVIA